MLALSLSAAHVHVMLNHLPIVGVIVAVIPLALALIWKDRRVLIAGLAISGLMSLSVPIVMESGDGAYRALSRGEMHEETFDEVGENWADIHEKRADITAIALWALVVVSVAGFICAAVLPKFQFKVGLLALVLCFVVFGLAAWTGDAGGKIRHAEFRDAEPPGSDSSAAQISDDLKPDQVLAHHNGPTHEPIAPAGPIDDASIPSTTVPTTH